MTTEILAFKLISGDEIVAQVVSRTPGLLTDSSDSKPTAYVVRRPHILQMQQMGPGQVGLAFIPWTLSNPTIERMELPASAILLTYPPSDNVEQQYMEQTSALQVVKQQSRIST
jgi:hypothetical protein